MTRTIHIALADDQALVRGGLRALLRDFETLQVVIEASDGQELLDSLESTPVDVVLSDIRMPGMDGLELVRILRARGDQTPVVLLTTFREASLALRAAQAGAQGFLLKDASPEELCETILAVSQGEVLLAPVPTHAVRTRYAFRDVQAPKETFNEREVAILRLISGGYSNREIARAVCLSEGTVKNYISEILHKLDARDRTGAVLKAITLRII